jgi:hypothetical protein
MCPLWLLLFHISFFCDFIVHIPLKTYKFLDAGLQTPLVANILGTNIYFVTHVCQVAVFVENE